MQLLKCDECGAVHGNVDPVGWLVLTDLDDDDDDTLAFWHFCGWACCSTYSTARALVDS